MRVDVFKYVTFNISVPAHLLWICTAIDCFIFRRCNKSNLICEMIGKKDDLWHTERLGAVNHRPTVVGAMRTSVCQTWYLESPHDGVECDVFTSGWPRSAVSICDVWYAVLAGGNMVCIATSDVCKLLPCHVVERNETPGWRDSPSNGRRCVAHLHIFLITFVWTIDIFWFKHGLYHTQPAKHTVQNDWCNSGILCWQLSIITGKALWHFSKPR